MKSNENIEIFSNTPMLIRIKQNRNVVSIFNLQQMSYLLIPFHINNYLIYDRLLLN